MFDMYKPKPRPIKEVIYDWAHGTLYQNKMALEIVDKVLDLVVPVNDIWTEDKAYVDINYKVGYKRSSLSIKYNNISQFLNYYYSEEFKAKAKSYIDRYKGSLIKAKIGAISYFIQLVGNKIDAKGAVDLYKNLEELDELMAIRQITKVEIIKENADFIFGNSRMIDLYQMKYPLYKSLIGQYDDCIKYLGENGINLRNGTKEAIDYVTSYEDLENRLLSAKAKAEFQINRIER